MTNWTKEPWRAVNDGHGGRSVEATDFNGNWKYIARRVNGGTPEEADANTNLIAAAPMLFEALSELLKCHSEGGFVQPDQPVLADAEMALAFALGQDPNKDSPWEGVAGPLE